MLDGAVVDGAVVLDGAAVLGGVVADAPGSSAPQSGVWATPSVSGTWLGTDVNGVVSGVLVNAPYIGVAAASFWFSGWAPRICSIVRTSVSCE